MRSRRVLALLSAAAVAALLTGCAQQAREQALTGSGSAESQPAASGPANLSGSLTVYAAASLTASFNDLTAEFARKHPGVTVKPVRYDGSSTLAIQVQEGAPADVFASADQATMSRVSSLMAGQPAIFASNTLEIAVRPGNPKHIGTLAELADPGVLTVLCAAEVPCGAASSALLQNSGVRLRPASEEQNVKAVITKVREGEADAGLVYVTDVQAAHGAVHGIPVPGSDRAANHYPIAALQRAASPAVARAFVQFVRSEQGQEILARYGFGAP